MTNQEWFAKNNVNLKDAHNLFIKSDLNDDASFWNWLGEEHIEDMPKPKFKVGDIILYAGKIPEVIVDINDNKYILTSAMDYHNDTYDNFVDKILIKDQDSVIAPFGHVTTGKLANAAVMKTVDTDEIKIGIKDAIIKFMLDLGVYPYFISDLKEHSIKKIHMNRYEKNTCAIFDFLYSLLWSKQKTVNLGKAGDDFLSHLRGVSSITCAQLNEIIDCDPETFECDADNIRKIIRSYQKSK